MSYYFLLAGYHSVQVHSPLIWSWLQEIAIRLFQSCPWNRNNHDHLITQSWIIKVIDQASRPSSNCLSISRPDWNATPLWEFAVTDNLGWSANSWSVCLPLAIKSPERVSGRGKTSWQAQDVVIQALSAGLRWRTFVFSTSNTSHWTWLLQISHGLRQPVDRPEFWLLFLIPIRLPLLLTLHV